MNGYGHVRRKLGWVIGSAAVLVPFVLLQIGTSGECDLDNGQVARLIFWPAFTALTLSLAFALVVPPQPLRASGWRYVFAATAALSAATLAVALGLLLINMTEWSGDCSG